METLTNKIAIISGNTGVAFSVTRVFVDKGATVIVVSRNEAHLETAQHSIKSETGVTVEAYVADIT